MAGSRTLFNYTDDAGIVYTVKLDESNSGATTISGERLMPLRTAAAANIPGGNKLRYCLAYVASNPRIRRKFYIGNLAAIASVIAPGATLQAAVYPNPDDSVPTAVPWIITAYRGEERSISPATTALDTGLIDGTPTP